jgi:hypothetical protein
MDSRNNQATLKPEWARVGPSGPETRGNPYIPNVTLSIDPLLFTSNDYGSSNITRIVR